MATKSRRVIYPLSYKTAAYASIPLDSLPFFTPGDPNYAYSYIGFQVVQPYNLYRMRGLRLHFKTTFASGIPSTLTKVQKISVGGFTGGMNVDFEPVAGVLDFNIDLSSLMTPVGDDTVYIYFPAGLSAAAPGATWYSAIVVEMLKVDILYETFGVN
jgi:hypothetical protein